MKKSAFSLLALSCILSPVSASAQDIVGSWKHSAFYQNVISTGEKRFPFGQRIVGRSIYTKDGTFCTMTTGVDRKQSEGAPTDEERVVLFKTMYSYCGTYRVDAGKMTAHADVAWTPNWTRRPGTVSLKFDGNRMTHETGTFKSQLDGVDVVAVLEFERE
jgi:hypothetical protein